MIDIYSGSKIYILCVPAYATGGTELLHQLAGKLCKHGYEASVYYFPEGHPSPVHAQFAHYNTNIADTIEDKNQHVLIMPEIYIDLFRSNKFKKIRKVIWWLSVDDYVNRMNELISRKKQKKFYSVKRLFGWYKFADLHYLKKSNIRHLAQSQYALEFLKENGVTQVDYLSDYLNQAFLTKTRSVKPIPKEDIVLYNPKKGHAFTQKLIAAAPDINWKPIENLKPEQVAELLAMSKVYIDFGPHPGKDRFPREAAIMGCCIITGKRGSANYADDLPLPPNFKFDEDQVDAILNKIRLCLQDFDAQCSLFNDYRGIINEEENAFEKQLAYTFRKT